MKTLNEDLILKIIQYFQGIPKYHTRSYSKDIYYSKVYMRPVRTDLETIHSVMLLNSYFYGLIKNSTVYKKIMLNYYHSIKSDYTYFSPYNMPRESYYKKPIKNLHKKIHRCLKRHHKF
jgi:hypothetical protein